MAIRAALPRNIPANLTSKAELRGYIYMALMLNWTQGGFKPLAVECGISPSVSGAWPRNRAGMVFSGGIDSLAALRLNRFFGAVLVAVAHAFSSRIDLCYIASSYDIENLAPCGSHSLLAPQYSSFAMKISHRDLSWSRIDKITLIKGWKTGMDNLRVCPANVKDRLNCGRCEKCVRTMTGLVAVDALDKCGAFVENDVTQDMFHPFEITIRHREPFLPGASAPAEGEGEK